MTMLVFDPGLAERLITMINADPEFRLTARLISEDILLAAGDKTCIVSIRDGFVTALTRPSVYDTWDFCIRAVPAAWENFFQAEPPPFFNGLYSGLIRGNFEIAGNLENAFACYPAVSRMLDVLRQATIGLSRSVPSGQT